jgi:pSer/pThr/pTyr-binding forkhead associated (FHA) protein
MRVELLSTGFRVLIDHLPVLVGRSLDADVCLPDPEISRYHCRLEQFDDLLLIRDTGSKNGTFVNGRPVVESVLHCNDFVTLGSTRFVVWYQRGTEAPPRSQPNLQTDMSFLDTARGREWGVQLVEVPI